MNKLKIERKGLLYTKAKIFHFKEKLDSLPLDKNQLFPPIHIRIKPTNACNHNCRYCAYRKDGLQLGQDMAKGDFIPRQKMREIIEDIKELGVRAVTFSGGGEPFCYPYLPEAVELLIKKKIKFSTLTNGAKLEGALAKVFAFNATWVRVSIDGWDDESYSSYRRAPEREFTKVMDNMHNFKQFGGSCYLGVSLIVDKDNAGHVYELIAKLFKIRIDSVKISPCIISNDREENNNYHKAIFDTVKSQVQKARGDFGREGFEIFDSYHLLDEKFHKDYNWCPYQQILPVIGADLNIYPCQDKAYNLKEGLVGSIKKRRFKDFWFSDKNVFFKIDPAVHCDHHCVANEKNKLILEYLNADKEHLEFV